MHKTPWRQLESPHFLSGFLVSILPFPGTGRGNQQNAQQSAASQPQLLFGAPGELPKLSVCGVHVIHCGVFSPSGCDFPSRLLLGSQLPYSGEGPPRDVSAAVLPGKAASARVLTAGGGSQS